MTARIFDPGPATGNLTAKQEFALQWITEHNTTGLTSGRLGHAIHLWKGCRYCTAHEPCRYAASSGETIGVSLRNKDLTIKRKHLFWTLKHPPAKPLGEIPF